MKVSDFSALHPWVFPTVWVLILVGLFVLCRQSKLEFTDEEKHNHQGAFMGVVLVGIPVFLLLYVVWLIYAKSFLAWLHPILVGFGL